MKKLIDVYVISVENSKILSTGERNKSVHYLKSRNRILQFIEIFTLIARLQRNGYRHFYIHYTYIAAIAVCLASKIWGGTTAYWNSMSVKPIVPSSPLSMSRLSQAMLRITILLGDYLITGSHVMQKNYHSWSKKNISRIIPLGPSINFGRYDPAKYDRNLARAQLGIPEGIKTIVFCHDLSKDGGTDFLIPIATYIRKKVSQFAFLIVGDGPEQEKLMRKTQEKGLSDLVKFLGKVPNRDMPHILVAADIFLLPSLAEALPRGAFEALAMDVSIAMFLFPGMDSTLLPTNQRVRIVPSYDWKRLSEEVVELLSIQIKDNTLRKFVLERFDHAQIARKIIKIFYKNSPQIF